MTEAWALYPRLRPLTADETKMVEDNLGLVGWCLNRTGRNNDEDAYQDGVLGLMAAATKFDPTIAKFSTYATAWILQAMQRGRIYSGDVDHRLQPRPRHLSLDAPRGRGDVDLNDVLDGAADPAGDALGAIYSERLGAALRGLARDGLDRDIVDALTAGQDLNELETFRPVVAKWHVTHQNCRDRKAKLLARYTHPARRKQRA